jgi:hypothetical protein
MEAPLHQKQQAERAKHGGIGGDAEDFGLMPGASCERTEQWVQPERQTENSCAEEASSISADPIAQTSSNHS